MIAVIGERDDDWQRLPESMVSIEEMRRIDRDDDAVAISLLPEVNVQKVGPRSERLIPEPFLELPEQDTDASELDKAEKVGRVILPSNLEKTLQLQPREELFNQPASLIATQATSVMGEAVRTAITAMRRNHLDPVFRQLSVRHVTVVRLGTDQVLRLRFDHVELEAQLHQRYVVVICCMCADRQRQTVLIENSHNCHILTASRRTNLGAAAFRAREPGVDKAFLFVAPSYFTQRVRQVRQDVSQHFPLAPLLELAMHRFVVWIGPRQHVPLRAGIQNPKNCFENFARGDRLATGPAFDNMLLRTIFPNPFSLLAAQPNYYANQTSS